jgi:hypothetical protein
MYIASQLCTNVLEKIELDEIRSKCVVFPDGVRSDLTKEHVGTILKPEDWDRWYVTEMIE